MKKNIIIAAAMVAVLGLSGAVSAAETNTYANKAGITPDNVVFYPLDKALEGLRIAVSSGLGNKADIISKIAEERLGESEVMASKGKTELAKTALDEYNKDITEAFNNIKTVTKSEIEANGTISDKIKAIEERIAERQAKSLDVLNKMEDNASENAKTTLQMVIDMQTAKKEAMVNILKSKQLLMGAREALNIAKSALEQAKTSGDAGAISQAKALLAEKQLAFDSANSNYKIVFDAEKANMKTSVGKLKNAADTNSKGQAQNSKNDNSK